LRPGLAQQRAPWPVCAAAVRRCSTCRIRIIGDCPRPAPNPRSARRSCSAGSVGCGSVDPPRLSVAAGERSFPSSSSFLPHAVSSDSHASNPTRIGPGAFISSACFVEHARFDQACGKKSAFRSDQPSSSSTGFLGAVCRRRCSRAAASRTSSSATAWLALFGLAASRTRGLPPGAQGPRPEIRDQCRRAEQISGA